VVFHFDAMAVVRCIFSRLECCGRIRRTWLGIDDSIDFRRAGEPRAGLKSFGGATRERSLSLHLWAGVKIPGAWFKPFDFLTLIHTSYEKGVLLPSGLAPCHPLATPLVVSCAQIAPEIFPLTSTRLAYTLSPMSNKAVADAVLKGKKSFVKVKTLREATAIRVAGHRLGGVLTVKAEKSGFRLVKSSARVTHRPTKTGTSKNSPGKQKTAKAKPSATGKPGRKAS
jgi:hypothetical protein